MDVRGKADTHDCLTAIRSESRDFRRKQAVSLLEHPIIAGLVVTVIIAVSTWIWAKFFQPEIRIKTAIEQGPTNGRELGFTEPAVKITVMNVSSKDITIKDIRLMFSGAFGASVAPEAPAGRSHRALPVSLASGAEENWYVPAEKLSGLLRSLHHPPSLAGSVVDQVKLHARCIIGTGKVCKSSDFLLSTDPDSHW